MDPSEEEVGRRAVGRAGVDDFKGRGAVTAATNTQGKGAAGVAAKLYGLGVTFKKSDGYGGMVVKRIKADGAAAHAGGLEAGDRVLTINGTALDDVTDALQLSKLTHGEDRSVAILQVG